MLSRGNQFYVGDCREWIDRVPDRSVALCYLDPPYKFRNPTLTMPGHAECRGYEGLGGEPNPDKPWESYRELFAKIVSKLQPGGVLLFHCDSEHAHQVRVVLDEVLSPSGFRNEIIWVLNRKVPDNKKPADGFVRNYDKIIFYQNGRGEGRRREKMQIRLNRWSDVWSDIPTLKPGSPEVVGYPTQKPAKLIARLVDIFTEPGDAVLDPFSGSGTTLEVAAGRGRRFVGGDRSLQAARIIIERLVISDKFTDVKVIGIQDTLARVMSLSAPTLEEAVCEIMGWQFQPERSALEPTGLTSEGLPVWILAPVAELGSAIQMWTSGQPMGRSGFRGIVVVKKVTQRLQNSVATVSNELKFKISLIEIGSVFGGLLKVNRSPGQIRKLNLSRVWSTS